MKKENNEEKEECLTYYEMMYNMSLRITQLRKDIEYLKDINGRLTFMFLILGCIVGILFYIVVIKG